jgi:hypothetical protein
MTVSTMAPPGMGEYLTAGDAGKILDLSADGVRLAAASNHLRIAAVTPRGVRLFLRSDVEAFKKQRARRRR